jgi:hypothetical protein
MAKYPDVRLRIFTSGSGPRVGWWARDEATGKVLASGFSPNKRVAVREFMQWAQEASYASITDPGMEQEHQNN